jgi:hypothetical protein
MAYEINTVVVQEHFPAEIRFGYCLFQLQSHYMIY